jgi:hypothetical protein
LLATTRRDDEFHARAFLRRACSTTFQAMKEICFVLNDSHRFDRCSDLFRFPYSVLRTFFRFATAFRMRYEALQSVRDSCDVGDLWTLVMGM